MFAGCDLDSVPMRRELTTLIMAQLAAEIEAGRPQQRRPAPPPPPPSMAESPAPAAQESGGERLNKAFSISGSDWPRYTGAGARPAPTVVSQYGILLTRF